MKLKPLAVAAFILTGGVSAPAGAATLLFEDFEDDVVTYTTSVPEFSVPHPSPTRDFANDYFIRTDGGHIDFENFTDVQGSFYFAAQDIDGGAASALQTQTFGGINITGFSGLSFSAFFAEDDNGSNQSWDASDFVHVDYRIDDDSFRNLFWIENDGSDTNSAPFVDTAFDGTGDGTEITDTFTRFTYPIARTGSTLDLRVTYNLNGGGEDIAVDNVTISGVAAVPEPATLGLGLVGAVMLIRRWGKGVQVA